MKVFYDHLYKSDKSFLVMNQENKLIAEKGFTCEMNSSEIC